MKRTKSVLFPAFLLLAVASAAGAQMMDMGQKPCGQMPMKEGAMGQGMMPGMGMPCGMMGQGQGMMGPMAGQAMMPCGMMMGMMPPNARGCMELSCRMMDPGAEMAPLHEALGLTPEQVDKLKESHRPFQKEAVRIGASLKIAEMDLADLLSAENLDLKKIESKFKETEGIRTSLAMNHVNALAAVRKILTKDQIEKLANMRPCGGAPCGPGAPCPPGTPCPQGTPCFQQTPVQETPAPGPAPGNEQHH